MKELSIVMAYHNRPSQLELTLRTILRQYSDDIEIIVVDDASDKINDPGPVISKFNMDISVIRFNKLDKTWMNPCIPYNAGFRRATGRLVMIQNPECFHVGNVIQWARQWTTKNRYMTFSCYNSTIDEFRRIEPLVRGSMHGEQLESEVLRLININSSDKVRPNTEDKYWFNHPTIHPVKYHFCSVMTRDNLFDMGGFDERYADGYCWDDNEFLWRVQKKGLEVIIVGPEHGFVIHQWHEKGPLRGACSQWHHNKWLYENVTKKSSLYKVGCI